MTGVSIPQFKAIFLRTTTIAAMDRVLSALVPPCREAGPRHLSLRYGAVDYFVLAADSWAISSSDRLAAPVAGAVDAAYREGATAVWVFTAEMEAAGPRLVPPRAADVLPTSVTAEPNRWDQTRLPVQDED